MTTDQHAALQRLETELLRATGKLDKHQNRWVIPTDREEYHKLLSDIFVVGDLGLQEAEIEIMLVGTFTHCSDGQVLGTFPLAGELTLHLGRFGLHLANIEENWFDGTMQEFLND